MISEMAFISHHLISLLNNKYILSAIAIFQIPRLITIITKCLRSNSLWDTYPI